MVAVAPKRILCVQPCFCSKRIGSNFRLSCLGPNSRPAMLIVTITGLGGHLFDLEMQCGDISCWDVMREIKSRTRIRVREQQIISGETVLAPSNIIPNGDGIVLTLARVKVAHAVCGSCGRRQRRGIRNLCSRCLIVAYCDAACQNADWKRHKKCC